MKECPVCSAVTFDDMDICYGCLHRFSGADAIAASATARGKGAFAVQPANGSLAGGGPSGCKPSPDRPREQGGTDRPARAYRVEITLVPIDQAR